MTKRYSLTAALVALGLLWVLALPATAAVDSWDNGTAEGVMDLGPDWADACTDTGKGQPQHMRWNDHLKEHEGVYRFRATVTSSRRNIERLRILPPGTSGFLDLCGRVTRDGGDDPVHAAVGAACHAGTASSLLGMDSYSGVEGLGRIDSYDPAVPDVQVRNLRWAPSLTGQFLATADYSTLPEGPGSSTGVFVMLFGGQVGSNSCFPVYDNAPEGGWWAANTFWAAWQLIPTS